MILSERETHYHNMLKKQNMQEKAINILFHQRNQTTNDNLNINQIVNNLNNSLIIFYIKYQISFKIVSTLWLTRLIIDTYDLNKYSFFNCINYIDNFWSYYTTWFENMFYLIDYYFFFNDLISDINYF